MLPGSRSVLPASLFFNSPACKAAVAKKCMIFQELMQKKEIIGDLLNQLRLIRQRAAFEGMPFGVGRGKVNAILAQLLLLSEHLDTIIGAPSLQPLPVPLECLAHTFLSRSSSLKDEGVPSFSLAGPMLEQDGQYFNQRWGYLSRAGLNDKSQFTRQIEKYAGANSLWIRTRLHRSATECLYSSFCCGL